jgi:hypothetical protein
MIISVPAQANSCADKITSYTTPQFFLLSDTVFSGTVLHIDNTTDHRWQIFFTVDKIWKGSTSEKPLTVMTNTLQGCGYSITSGEKYLVYASGYPSSLNVPWTKSYADAQSDIALLDDPKFQTQAATYEKLYKKLTTAQNMLFHTASNQSLPIFMSDIDEMTLTLVVGIDDTKVPLLSADEYQKMVKNIVGNIPVKIVFGHNKPLGYNISGLSLSPLKQSKSGIATKDVTCKEGLRLAIKAEDGSPACIKPDTVNVLIERGWAKQIS